MRHNIIMNDNAQKWVERLLEDGPQAHGRLGNSDGSRCVLGAGCDVYAESHPTASWICRDVTPGYTLLGFNVGGVCDTLLPDPVRDWLGLRSECGVFRKDALCDLTCGADSLISLNDLMEWSLKEIGEFIRDHGDEVGLFI